MKLPIPALAGLIIGAGLLTCDMFSSRTVENPVINSSSINDPFSLYTILNYTGEEFSKTDYEDIFDSNFVFIDIDGAQSSRDEEIERLKGIAASCKCDSINTVWDTCNGVTEIQGDNTLTLCRSYKVSFFSVTGATIDSGKAQFHVRRSAENTWTILSWTEEGLQRSIFHP
ncbi:MAG: hypothetical protein WBM07_07080 [Chitinivibrionales bacterium]